MTRCSSRVKRKSLRTSFCETEKAMDSLMVCWRAVSASNSTTRGKAAKTASASAGVRRMGRRFFMWGISFQD
nr:MAG TPA: hypothetical protein [Caudoviricetes sp.]